MKPIESMIMFIVRFLLVCVILLMIYSILTYGNPTQPIPTDLSQDQTEEKSTYIPSALYNAIFNALIRYGFTESEAIALTNEIGDYYYIQSNMPTIEVIPATVEITNVKITDGTTNDTRVVTLHIVIKWIDSTQTDPEKSIVFMIEFDVEETITIVPTQTTTEQKLTPAQYFIFTGITTGYNLLLTDQTQSSWIICSSLTIGYDFLHISNFPLFVGITIGFNDKMIGLAIGTMFNNFYISAIIGSTMGISLGFFIKI